MPESPQVTINIRLSPALLEQLDHLAEALQADPELSARGKVTRTGLIRECIVRCLPALEKKAKELESREPKRRRKA
jgi:predicted transcriptional regulator